jgi:hypothetical protein
MPNMSYCRFWNTLQDLRDCFDNLNDDVSLEEDRARRRLIELCCEIAEWADSEHEEEEA